MRSMTERGEEVAFAQQMTEGLSYFGSIPHRFAEPPLHKGAFGFCITRKIFKMIPPCCPFWGNTGGFFTY